VVRGDIDCTFMLLDHRDQVDVDKPDMTGRTPLISSLITILSSVKHEGLPSHLYDRSMPSEEALVHSRYNRMAVVEALIRAGKYGSHRLRVKNAIFEKKI